jgi:hypothetical protein
MKKKYPPYDYIIFAATIVIIAAASAWYVPKKLVEPASFVFRYCDDSSTAYVDWSRSTQTARVGSTLPEEYATYYTQQGVAFSCPFPGMDMGSECRHMLDDVSDWSRVCSNMSGDMPEGEEYELGDEVYAPYRAMCGLSDVAGAAYSSTHRIVRIVSALLGGGSTYYPEESESFSCPVVAPEYVTDACRVVGDIDDWIDVCSNEEQNETIYLDHPDITVSSPRPFENVSSPLTITGSARGTWYFEGTFPIVVVDWNGRIIGEGYATAQDDWMTDAYVPFKATAELYISPETPYGDGRIIFRKDNPSGLFEYDDAYELPIFFEGFDEASSEDAIYIEVM